MRNDVVAGFVVYGCSCAECRELQATGHFYPAPAAVSAACVLRRLLQLSVRFGDRRIDWDHIARA